LYSKTVLGNLTSIQTACRKNLASAAFLQRTIP
jgi:hypothetical protein